MNKNVVIAIVLGVLVVIAGVQAYQLMGLKSRLSAGGPVSGAGVGSAPATSSAGSPQLPSNLQNLPSMVGGC